MRKAVAILAFVAAAALCAPAADAVASFRVRAVSYNVRYKANDDTGNKSWDSRKAALCDFMEDIDPDVIGFQEVDPPQMTDLKALLPGYEIFGKHRESNNTQRGTPVAYRKSRFMLLDSGTFWLSTMPDVPGSKALGDGYTGTDPETCTWALLLDRNTRGVFCFFSTHLDYRQIECRKRQMAIAVTRVMSYADMSVPAILVGDMNSKETEDAIADVACSSLNDTCLVSQTTPTGPWRTFNNWTYKNAEVSCAEALANYSAEERTANGATLGSRIDYIFTTPGTEVEAFAIRNDPQPGKQQYPSDHYPVVADLMMPCLSDAWLRESAATSGWTGGWSDEVTYDANGRAYLGSRNGQVLFVPYNASTGNVVTVETKARFYAYVGHDTPDATAQAAVRLGTNGCFQVWTHLRQGYGGQAGWVDVVAEGMTPVSGEEYTLRTTFDYTANIYSVEVRTGLTGWTRFEEKDNPVNPVNPVKTSFPLAASTNCVSSIAFVGDTLFASLYGECRYEVIGFQPGEISVGDATVILDAAKAAWLNARGDYAAVNSRLANITSNEFATAWLCNLDLMNEVASAELKVTGVKVNADNVEIAVTLARTGAISQEINGVLKFYGASTLAAFKDDTAAPLVSTTLVDDDFSEDDTAIATFSKDDNTFFNAAVEER